MGWREAREAEANKVVVDTVGRHRDVKRDGEHKIATSEENREKLLAGGIVGG